MMLAPMILRARGAKPAQSDDSPAVCLTCCSAVQALLFSPAAAGSRAACNALLYWPAHIEVVDSSVMARCDFMQTDEKL